MEENKINIDKWFDKKLSISVGKLLIIAIISLLVYFGAKIAANRKTLVHDDSEKGLEIGSLIRKVKTELMKADTQAIQNNEDALFALKDFGMEISFTVRSVKSDNAKLDYQFVTVEGGAETANEKVQKLILHWDAIPPKAKKFKRDNKSSDMIIHRIDTPKTNSHEK